MMGKRHQTFSVELHPENMSQEDWDKFNALMYKVQDGYQEEIDNIQEEHQISSACAAAVWYLRSRSRWTEEKEQQLINMDRRGEPIPNVGAGEF
jgi:hypothetical protein